MTDPTPLDLAQIGADLMRVEMEQPRPKPARPMWEQSLVQSLELYRAWWLGEYNLRCEWQESARMWRVIAISLGLTLAVVIAVLGGWI